MSATAVRERHVIADIRYPRPGQADPGYCSCSCGWSDIPDHFQAHRTEAGARHPSSFAATDRVGQNEYSWKPGKLAAAAPPQEETMPTLPPRVPVTWPPQPCASCGTTYTPSRAVPGRMPLYCSDACRYDANRARKRVRLAGHHSPILVDGSAPEPAVHARSSSIDHVPAAPDLVVLAPDSGADHASDIPGAIHGTVVQHESFMPAASDVGLTSDPPLIPNAVAIAAAMDAVLAPLVDVKANGHAADESHVMTAPDVIDEPSPTTDGPAGNAQEIGNISTPTDEWRRGYEEGYRQDVETVDEARAEREYQRGWSMGVIDVCLSEALEYPGTPITVQRLVRRALKAVADL